MAETSTVHQDIIETHILTRVDGPTLASASCASSQLHSLASREHLWSKICRSTWPSTDTPRLRHVISSFPNGSRSFFSDAYPLITDDETPTTKTNLDRPFELISAVDIFYRGKLIFSKVVETETATPWFLCSPFRIDLVDQKDSIATPIPSPATEDTCSNLEEDLALSWIVIDSIGRRAANLSSHRPVSVEKHWLSGEVQARFATVIGGGERGSAAEVVTCGIVVTCGGGREGGDMHVREVSLQVEDMDGTNCNGRVSLVILGRAMEGKRGRGRREEEGKRRYEEFLEKKRERRERRRRKEGALDVVCVAFGVLAFGSFGLFFGSDKSIFSLGTFNFFG